MKTEEKCCGPDNDPTEYLLQEVRRLKRSMLGMWVVVAIIGVCVMLLTGCDGSSKESRPSLITPLIDDVQEEAACIEICRGTPPPTGFAPEVLDRCGGKIRPCRNLAKRDDR